MAAGCKNCCFVSEHKEAQRSDCLLLMNRFDEVDKKNSSDADSDVFNSFSIRGNFVIYI